MKYALTNLLFALSFTASATTFTVTTNADAGPGSLRDAITQAAANGSSTPDLIIFNITDQSRAGRTITLTSNLPDLTSNLTIDGTTQPGAPFGISAARVIITNPYAVQYLNYFQMIGVSNVQIYGLFLQGVGASYAFYFRQSSNLTFGAAAKGNIMQGFGTAIECDYITSTEPTSSNITIQGNIMGTDETGTTLALNTSNIRVSNVANLQIGGLDPGEGNLLNENSWPLEYTDTRDEDFGYLNIQGNKEGTDITGNITLSPNFEGWSINGYNNGNANVTGTTRLVVNITNNVTVGGFQFFDIASPFLIQGNHIGVGLDNITNLRTGTTYGNNCDIFLEYCGHGLIGGSDPADKNYLAYNSNGVYEFWCGPITISQNSIFCNTYGIQNDFSQYPHQAPFVDITLLTTSVIGGTANPNAKIELFYDDECPGCSGKTYIGTVNADNAGNWTYNLVATGAIVATATDTYGATSAFSTATINTDNIVIKNATCGRSNGSIKNIEVTSGTQWYWEDASGNIIANSVDLTDVGPGTYTFVTSIGGAACNATSTPYTITNVDLPAFDRNDINPTQPSCGQSNGAFQYTGAFDPSTTYSWLDANLDPIVADFSVDNPSTQLAPGNYNMRLTLKQDPTCTRIIGPFILTNQVGPSVITAGVVTSFSTCSQNNGSITGITYQNSTAPVYIAWRDAKGNTLANSLNLTNAYPGNYRLVYKDGGGCDSIFTNWYTISDIGTITYDTGSMIITDASCAAPNGSITGIQSTNANYFSWIATATGATSGDTRDISNLAGGVYRLDLGNDYGCEASIPGLVVAQIPKPAIDYSGLKYLADTCNAGLAAIQGLNVEDKTRTYTWAWYDLSGPSLVGSTPNDLKDLHAGNYDVTITDQYGCSVTSSTLTTVDIELNPQLQVSGAYIPRNTSTTLVVVDPPVGQYDLLDATIPAANVLASSGDGVLQTPDIPQDETLYVKYSRGDCSAIVPVDIKVFDSVKIFVPNAFTPDKGVNSHWHIVVRGLIHKIHISVYDRWGAQVFSSEDPNAFWDGTNGGRILSGTFVYLITGVDYYRPFQYKGTLMIIR